MKKLLLSLALILSLASCSTPDSPVTNTKHEIILSSSYQFSAAINNQIVLSNGFSVTKTVNSGDAIAASNTTAKRIYLYVDGKEITSSNSILTYIVP